MTLTELRKKLGKGWDINAEDYRHRPGTPAWGADAEFTDITNEDDFYRRRKDYIATRIKFATRKEAVNALAEILSDLGVMK